MVHADGELTGNDYVTLPFIDADGSMDGVNVLHGGLAGLVEWVGGEDRAFLRPVVRIGGVEVSLEGARWRRLDRWIPTFSAPASPDLAIHGTICAPGGYPAQRGFMVRLELENRGRAPLDVVVALEVAWHYSRHWVATPRSFPGPNRMGGDGSGRALVLETDGGRGPAMAITAGGTPTLREGASAAGGAGVPADGFIEAANGTPLLATVEQSLTLVPSRRTAAEFYVGVGRERDGASAAAHALRRSGGDALLRQARLDLSYTLRAGQDHRWADLLNRNLIFNRYYAVGRGVDDDRLYLVRSRSTRCPAPALFNEREALLWTLPALVLADPGLAREALFRIFDMFSERSGEHLRYIDGGAYDTGFVLDQALLYPWIAKHYVAATGDESLLDEGLVRQVAYETDAALFTRLHPEHMLCSTELLPSGDAADHAYGTFGNALLWAFAEAIPELLPKEHADDPPPRFAGAGPEVAAAVWQHCVTELDGSPLLTSTADLDGASAIYDDPAGSLGLLPFFGFCADDDPVWSASMEFLRSPRYPLFLSGPVPGIATRSDPRRASLAALCTDLLGPGADDALRRLLLLRLPGGVAAAGYDPGTGMADSPHHAALAGFVAWTLVRAAEPRDGGRTARRRRR
jgi:uncharacterized protein